MGTVCDSVGVRGARLADARGGGGFGLAEGCSCSLMPKENLGYLPRNRSVVFTGGLENDFLGQKLEALPSQRDYSAFYSLVLDITGLPLDSPALNSVCRGATLSVKLSCRK